MLWEQGHGWQQCEGWMEANPTWDTEPRPESTAAIQARKDEAPHSKNKNRPYFRGKTELKNTSCTVTVAPVGTQDVVIQISILFLNFNNSQLHKKWLPNYYNSQYLKYLPP